MNKNISGELVIREVFMGFSHIKEATKMLGYDDVV
jgi:hypothetical protein